MCFITLRGVIGRRLRKRLKVRRARVGEGGGAPGSRGGGARPHARPMLGAWMLEVPNWPNFKEILFFWHHFAFSGTV